jgi:hypothetical protein
LGAGEGLPFASDPECESHTNRSDSRGLVYLAVDYDTGEIGLVGVTQNEVTPAPAMFPSAAVGCEDSDLATRAIVAIVLGTIFGLALIGGLTYCFFRRRRRQNVVGIPKDADYHDQASPAPAPAMNNLNQLQRDTTEMSDDCQISELESPNDGYPHRHRTILCIAKAMSMQ